MTTTKEKIEKLVEQVERLENAVADLQKKHARIKTLFTTRVLWDDVIQEDEYPYIKNLEELIKENSTTMEGLK